MICQPKTEFELLENARRIEGMSFGYLAKQLGFSIPQLQKQRKGWMGRLIEIALGADLHTLPIPDFKALNIELKTLPLDVRGKPCESTFVTSIPLTEIHKETWETSSVKHKLSKVLWVLIEGDRSIPYQSRRIGQALLWSPKGKQLNLLKNDWLELTNKIVLGELESIDASFGQALQIRPKAANAKSLCDAYDSEGKLVKTLPRGFYLRTSFTAQVLQF
jgi:DNA mismatch repair protein MutH